MTLGAVFSIRLDELLKKENIKLNQFLVKNCIARSTIVNLQLGNTKSPTLATIYQVAYGFGMTPIEFLDHEVFKREDIEYM